MLAFALATSMLVAEPPTQVYEASPSLGPAKLTLLNVEITLGKEAYHTHVLAVFKYDGAKAAKAELHVPFLSHGTVPGQQQAPAVLLRRQKADLARLVQSKDNPEENNVSEIVRWSVTSDYQYAASLQPGETISVQIDWDGAPGKIGYNKDARQVAFLLSGPFLNPHLDQVQVSLKDPEGLTHDLKAFSDFGKPEIGDKGAFVGGKDQTLKPMSYCIFQYYPTYLSR